MPKKKYTEGQIALVVKELENGAKVEDLCRKLGVSEATGYNWRANSPQGSSIHGAI